MAKLSSAREDLLHAAAELFRARGYEGVGVAELLEASGAPRGSLYFHFPGGKEQSGVEVVEAVGAAVTGQFKALAERDITLDAFVDHVFRHTAKMVKEREFNASCPIAAIAAECGAQAPALRAAVTKQFDAWQDEVARAAGLRGFSEKAATEFGSALITAMEGAFLVSKAQRSVAPHQNAAKAVKALAAQLAAN